MLVRGDDLDEAAASQLAAAVGSGGFDVAQLAGILCLLASRGGESATVVAALATELRRHAIQTGEVRSGAPVVDIVGTGGDGHDTINISTASAIVAASTGLVRVAKHGSIGVSSRSGSADVLQALGVATLPPEHVAPCVDACGIAFMFAPLHHPALAKVAPLRRSLRIRTVFNVMGPLLNPCPAARALVLGVFSPRLLPVYAEAVTRLDIDRALIVHCGGLDELAPTSAASVIDVRRVAASSGDCAAGVTPAECWESHSSSVDASDWGIPRYDIADLRGGSPAENAAALRALLSAHAAVDAADLTAHPAAATLLAAPRSVAAMRHAIAMNAGACLYVAGSVATLHEGWERAAASMAAGAALRTLNDWAAVTERLAPPTAPPS